MGITTKDLAQICGVSRTTVHRALHDGTGRINPDTREMILQVARENGYRPDLLARGLVKGQTFNIGVVVLDVKNRYFAQMLSAIGAEANRRGYFVNITLHGNDKETEKSQLTRLVDYRVDGIIVSSVNEGEDYRKFLQSLNVPIVSVDNKIADGIPFVGIDQRRAMRQAAEKVMEKGYTKLVYICPPIDDQSGRNIYVHRERLAGFQEAVGKVPDVETVYLLDWNYLEKVREALNASGKTAFICAADEFALDVMKYLKKERKKAGIDYGIVGFDNIDVLDYVVPRLTTISNSVEEVAGAAVGLLFEMINDKAAGQERKEPLFIQHHFVEGETI